MPYTPPLWSLFKRNIYILYIIKCIENTLCIHLVNATTTTTTTTATTTTTTTTPIAFHYSLSPLNSLGLLAVLPLSCDLNFSALQPTGQMPQKEPSLQYPGGGILFLCWRVSLWKTNMAMENGRSSPGWMSQEVRINGS